MRKLKVFSLFFVLFSLFFLFGLFFSPAFIPRAEAKVSLSSFKSKLSSIFSPLQTKKVLANDAPDTTFVLSDYATGQTFYVPNGTTTLNSQRMMVRSGSTLTLSWNVQTIPDMPNITSCKIGWRDGNVSSGDDWVIVNDPNNNGSCRGQIRYALNSSYVHLALLLNGAAGAGQANRVVTILAGEPSTTAFLKAKLNTADNFQYYPRTIPLSVPTQSAIAPQPGSRYDIQWSTGGGACSLYRNENVVLENGSLSAAQGESLLGNLIEDLPAGSAAPSSRSYDMTMRPMAGRTKAILYTLKCGESAHEAVIVPTPALNVFVSKTRPHRESWQSDLRLMESADQTNAVIFNYEKLGDSPGDWQCDGLKYLPLTNANNLPEMAVDFVPQVRPNTHKVYFDQKVILRCRYQGQQYENYAQIYWTPNAPAVKIRAGYTPAGEYRDSTLSNVGSNTQVSLQWTAIPSNVNWADCQLTENGNTTPPFKSYSKQEGVSGGNLDTITAGSPHFEQSNPINQTTTYAISCRWYEGSYQPGRTQFNTVTDSVRIDLGPRAKITVNSQPSITVAPKTAVTVAWSIEDPGENPPANCELKNTALIPEVEEDTGTRSNSGSFNLTPEYPQTFTLTCGNLPQAAATINIDPFAGLYLKVKGSPDNTAKQSINVVKGSEITIMPIISSSVRNCRLEITELRGSTERKSTLPNFHNALDRQVNYDEIYDLICDGGIRNWAQAGLAKKFQFKTYGMTMDDSRTPKNPLGDVRIYRFDGEVDLDDLSTASDHYIGATSDNAGNRGSFTTILGLQKSLYYFKKDGYRGDILRIDPAVDNPDKVREINLVSKNSLPNIIWGKINNIGAGNVSASRLTVGVFESNNVRRVNNRWVSNREPAVLMPVNMTAPDKTFSYSFSGPRSLKVGITAFSNSKAVCGTIDSCWEITAISQAATFTQETGQVIRRDLSHSFSGNVERYKLKVDISFAINNVFSKYDDMVDWRARGLTAEVIDSTTKRPVPLYDATGTLLSSTEINKFNLGEYFYLPIHRDSYGRYFDISSSPEDQIANRQLEIRITNGAGGSYYDLVLPIVLGRMPVVLPSGEPGTAVVEIGVNLQQKIDGSVCLSKPKREYNFLFCGYDSRKMADEAAWAESLNKLAVQMKSLVTEYRLPAIPVVIYDDKNPNGEFFPINQPRFADPLNTKSVNIASINFSTGFLLDNSYRRDIDHALTHEFGHYKDYYSGKEGNGGSNSSTFLLTFLNLKKEARYSKRFTWLLEEERYHPGTSMGHIFDNLREVYASTFHIRKLHASQYDGWLNDDGFRNGSMVITLDGKTQQFTFPGILSTSDFNVFKNMVNTLNGYITGTEPLT